MRKYVHEMSRERVTLHIETEREDDGRWIAAVPELRGVMVHGKSQEMRSGRFVHWRFV
ncbi:MAG TPA: hypothetical protein VHU80_15340 [Polyangiaceae bacterium]|jgi:hypothetical protein|nr:hypothetical protein [Polyangiaceae bacterium]